MAVPLSVINSLVTGILSRVGEVKTNHEQCELLGSMAQQTLQVLENLEEDALSNPSISSTIELLHENLNEANTAIENCCKASFFSSLLWPESYSAPLKHAGDKLKHTLSLLPVASTCTVVDRQLEMIAMHDQVCHAKCDRRAAMAHQTIALRNKLDKAFHQNAQESEEIKELIRGLMQEHFLSQEKLKNELAALRRNANEAHMAKLNKEEYTIDQIIAVVAESLGEINEEPTHTQDIRESICCPISKEIMKDPLILKDSGMVYDRTSITEWFGRGHRYDPLTNVELMSKDFVCCHALREVCQLWLDRSGDSSRLIEDVEKDEDKPFLSPGVYEGHGKLFIGSSTIYMYQLLLFQPNGAVVSCTLRGTDNQVFQRNGLEVGGGEWDCKGSYMPFEFKHKIGFTTIRLENKE